MVSATSSAGLDVNGIVSQLMAAERRPLNTFAVREAGYQAKLSAYGSIKGAISSFQTALQGLNSTSKFQALTASSSDSAVLSASAAGTTMPGQYSLEVSHLAQAQKLVAAGQASKADAIGDGTATTVTFDFGTISGGTLSNGVYSGAAFASNGNGTKSITIDGSNNSLQGIRDAINAANLDVTASIINDGSGTPYRLALSSGNMGVTNSLKISVSGDAAIGELLSHDPAGTQKLSESVTAQNANFKINGIAVSKSANTVSDVVEGLTLNLSKTTTTPVTLTVARDTGTINNSISGFVKAYNELATTLKNLSSYDAATKRGAILQGDSTVRSLQTQLRNIAGSAIVGVPGDLTMLSTVGIAFQKDGNLAVDQAKLSAAIDKNFDGIASLFASVGKSSDSLVGFSKATADTKPGSYAVSVSQLATQGSTVGSGAITLPLEIIAGSNDTLQLSINGVSTAVTLTAGTYDSVQTLASALQAKINGSNELSSKGISVNVTENAGILTIRSTTYGSASAVNVSGGTAQVALGLDGATATDGVDVAGMIDGAAATGAGQVLTASGGNASGLGILVSGGTTGDRDVMHYSRGYAARLSEWAASVLASDSMIAARTDGLDRSIADIGKQRDSIEVRLAQIEKRYRAQFTALDTMLASMNSTSSFLTQQLANLPGSSQNK